MKCIYKGISESESPEASYIRSVHPEINFPYCRNHCKGYQLTDCPNFPAKTRAERVERVGRLESLEVFV